ncbi:MAG: hypothetical protein FJZ90_02770 [Chloroflexi bacterium]|nr:hypothetical protein [Chloroflexota bacterium]
MRKRLPALVTVLCGLLMLGDFFIPDPQMDALGAALAEGVTVLAAFALVLGALNILATHMRRVFGAPQAGTVRTSRGLSLVLVLALLITAAAGVSRPSSAAFAWIFEYIHVPLHSSMMALLSFFVVSAAYRSFRLRNLEAFVLAGTSLLVLLVQVPLGPALSAKLAILGDWIYSVPVAGGMRGILIGIALGTMATSLRVLFLVDRPYA